MLDPPFVYTTTTYSVTVLYATSGISFTATSSGATINYEYTPYNGALVSGSVASGVSSSSFSLNVGDNKLKLIPNAGAGTPYTITIRRQSNDATLSNLVCDQPYSPVFAPSESTFIVTIQHAITTWTCRPTSTQADATIEHALDQGAWQVVLSNAEAMRPMSVGDNRYEIRVTAEDPNYQQFYTFTVHRLSNDCFLADLAPSKSSLSPAFASNQFYYNMSLASSVPSLIFTPTFSYVDPVAAFVGTQPATNAWYKWNNISLPTTKILNQQPTQTLMLNEGDNHFEIRVEAEDSSIQSYYVTVHRISSDVRLSGLVMSPSGSGLTPAFNLDVFNYDVQVGYAISSSTFQFSLNYPLASQFWRVDGGPYSVAWGGDVPTDVIDLRVGDTIFEVNVIAEDQVSTQIYSVKVHRLSMEAHLASMTGTASLVPNFDTYQYVYNISLGASVSTFSLQAKPVYPLATIRTRLNGGNYSILPAQTLSPPFVLNEGDNVIDVRVTSEDLAYSYVYSIYIHLLSDICSLLSLQTTPAGSGLSPSFVPDNTSVNTYSMSLPAAFASLTITSVQAALATQEWALENGPLALFQRGLPSPSIPLIYGDNTIRVKVTAEDEITHQFYTILVHRKWSTSNLTSLVSSIALDPPFQPAQLHYAMTVASSVSTIKLTPTTQNPLATLAIQVDGAGFNAAANAQPTSPLPLNVEGPMLGDTVIDIKVQAEDASQSTVYTVVVHRLSATPTLSSLTVSPVGSGLQPVFDSATTSYTLEEVAAVQSIIFTPVPSYQLANVSWSLNDGAYSQPLSLPGTMPAIPLIEGDIVVNVRVIAEDSVTYTIYSIKAHRSSDTSSLRSVAASLPISPSFNTTRTSYSMTCGQSVSTVSFTPTVTYPLSTLRWSLNGGSMSTVVPSGQAITFSLVTGDNKVVLEVTSEDLSSITPYVFNIRRVSPTSSLASLMTTPLGQGLVPLFDSAVFHYTLTVEHSINALTVKSLFTYSASSQILLFNNIEVGALAENTDSPSMSLPIGDSAITLTVKAEDQVSYSTYSIAVHRLSKDSHLASLVASSSLSPPFDANIYAYNITTGNAIDIVTVTSTVGYPLSTQQMKFESGAYGTAVSTPLVQPFNLPVGDSVISIRVISEDTYSTSIYTIHVHRKSNDATLSALSVTPSGSGLVPVFNATTYSYKVEVDAGVASITITSSVTNVYAFQQWNLKDGLYTTYPSASTTAPIPLEYGNNNIKIKVTAEDLITNRIYAIVIHRKSSNAELSALSSSISLSPIFSPSVLNYAMQISSSVTSVTLRPTLFNPFATLYMDKGGGAGYENWLSGAITDPAIPLAVGDTTILIKVQAEDTTANSVYTISIHRLSPVATLAALSISPAGEGLVPNFASSTLTYSLTVLSTVTDLTFTPSLTDALAKVEWSINGAAYSAPMTSGASTPAIPIPTGHSLISLRVTAEDGITKKTYSVDVNHLSGVSTLQTLVSSITLRPAFSPSTLTYSMTVASGVSSVRFTPRPSSSAASMMYAFNTGGSTAIASEVSTPSLTLQPGDNVCTFTVTSEDTLSVTTYTLNVYQISSDASLFSLNLDPPGSGLQPPFSSSVFAYSFRVAPTVASIELTSVVHRSPANQQWNMDRAPWSTPTSNTTQTVSGIPLPMGNSVLYVKVIAEDAVTSLTYVIQIRRVSGDATLPSISGNFVTQPVYSPNTFSYDVTVPALQDVLSLSFLTPSSESSIAWSRGVDSLDFSSLTLTQDVAANSASGSLDVSVPIGNSTLNVRAISEDTFNQNLYIFHILRLSNDTTLVSLSLPNLTPPFDPAIVSYDAPVRFNETSITVSACATYSPWASFSVSSSYLNFQSPQLACHQSVTFPIMDGSQRVEVVARAQDGSTRAYVINVRQLSHDDSLRMLEVVDPSLTVTPMLPLYTAGVTDYAVNVSQPVSSIQLHTQLNDTWATFTYQYHALSLVQPAPLSALISGVNGVPFTIPLEIGSTLVRIVVTAEDGLVSSAFNVTIRRSPYALNGLPDYFVTAARFNLRLVPMFGNATFIPLTLTLPNIDNGSVVIGTQTGVDRMTALAFAIDTPTSRQPMVEVAFTIAPNALDYIAPLPVYRPLVSGYWSSSLLPAPPQPCYANEIIELSFVPSEGVAGVIHIAFNATLDGVSIPSLPSPVPSGLSFPVGNNDTLTMPWQLPSTPGLMLITPQVSGFVALNPITINVLRQSQFVLDALPAQLTITTPYILTLTPTAAPNMNGVDVELSSDRAAFDGSGSKNWKLHFPPGVTTPVSFAMHSPSTRGNFTLSFRVLLDSPAIGSDGAHFASPATLHLFASDGCDPKPCSAVSIACLPRGGTDFECVCPLGYSGKRCDVQAYTGPMLPPAAGTRGPVAIVSATETVNPCEDVYLDASRSYGLEGVTEDITFTWHVTSIYVTGLGVAVPLYATSSSAHPIVPPGAVPYVDFSFQTSSFANSSSSFTAFPFLPTPKTAYVLPVPDFSRLRIPAGTLSAGYSYVFQVVCSNSYSQSAAAEVTVSASNDRADWTPHISIMVPTVLYTHVDSVIRSHISPSSCASIPTDMEYKFEWSVTRKIDGLGYISGMNLVSQLPSAFQSILAVPAGVFLPGQQYKIVLSCEMTKGASDAGGWSRRRLLVASTEAETSSVAVTIARSPIQLHIYGAIMRRRPVDQPFNLDATAMWDPEYATRFPGSNYNNSALTLTWTCGVGQKSSGASALPACSFATTPDMTASLLTVAAGALPPSQWYTFTLHVQDSTSNRTASTWCEVYLDPSSSDPTLTLNIVDAPSWIGQRAKLRLQTTVKSSTATSPDTFTYTWTSKPALDLSATSTILRSKPNAAVLELAPGSLTSPQYVFDVRVCSPVDMVCTNASHIVGVSQPPISGALTVSPTSGVALETPFTITASGWVDPYAQDPLTYLFTCIDLGSSASQELYLSSVTTATQITTMLPPGRLQLRVYVMNQQGATATGDVMNILTSVAPLFSVSPTQYASNLTSVILPGVVAQQNPVQSLALLQQIAALSNVITPSEPSAGATIRQRVWEQLPIVLDWVKDANPNDAIPAVITADASAVAQSGGDVDSIMIAQLVAVMETLAKYAAPAGTPSTFSLAAPILNALFPTIPPAVTSMMYERALKANGDVNAGYPQMSLSAFLNGLLDRDLLVDRLFQLVFSMTRACSDVNQAKSLLLKLMRQLPVGTTAGETTQAGTDATRMIAIVRRLLTPPTGPGSSVSVLLSTPLYNQTEYELVTSLPPQSNFDLLSSHPSNEVYLDSYELRFEQSQFASCRQTSNLQGLQTRVESDLTYLQLTWSNQSALHVNMSAAAPPPFGFHLQFNTAAASIAPHVFKDCGESDAFAQSPPPVSSLECVMWDDVLQQYVSVSSETSFANTSVAECLSKVMGEYAIAYYVDPAASSPPCEAQFGDIWLIIVGGLNALLACAAVGCGMRMAHKWHRFGGKMHLFIGLALVLYVATTRAYTFLNGWLHPDSTDDLQLTILQLLPYLAIHWIWVCAAFQWFRSFNHLRTIHHRTKSHTYFQPSWARKPFLHLFLLALLASIAVFTVILFIRADRSVDLLYRIVNFAYSVMQFALCIACLAALLPSTHQEDDDEHPIKSFSPMKESDELDGMDVEKHASRKLSMNASSVSGRMDAYAATHHDMSGETDKDGTRGSGSKLSRDSVRGSFSRDDEHRIRVNTAWDEDGDHAPKHRRTPTLRPRRWMLYAEKHVLLRRETLLMRLMPFVAACCYLGSAILSFIAGSNDDQLMVTTEVGFPYYVVEAVILYLLLTFAMATSILSGLTRKYPCTQPEEPTPILMRQSSSVDENATAAAAVAAAKAAAEAALAAAATPKHTPQPTPVMMPSPDFSPGKIAFDVAQAIFEHQQQLLAREGHEKERSTKLKRTKSKSKRRQSTGNADDFTTLSPAMGPSATPASPGLGGMSDEGSPLNRALPPPLPPIEEASRPSSTNPSPRDSDADAQASTDPTATVATTSEPTSNSDTSRPTTPTHADKPKPQPKQLSFLQPTQSSFIKAAHGVSRMLTLQSVHGTVMSPSGGGMRRSQSVQSSGSTPRDRSSSPASSTRSTFGSLSMYARALGRRLTNRSNSNAANTNTNGNGNGTVTGSASSRKSTKGNMSDRRRSQSQDWLASSPLSPSAKASPYAPSPAASNKKKPHKQQKQKQKHEQDDQPAIHYLHLPGATEAIPDSFIQSPSHVGSIDHAHADADADEHVDDRDHDPDHDACMIEPSRGPTGRRPYLPPLQLSPPTKLSPAIIAHIRTPNVHNDDKEQTNMQVEDEVTNMTLNQSQDGQSHDSTVDHQPIHQATVDQHDGDVAQSTSYDEYDNGHANANVNANDIDGTDTLTHSDGGLSHRVDMSAAMETGMDMDGEVDVGVGVDADASGHAMVPTSEDVHLTSVADHDGLNGGASSSDGYNYDATNETTPANTGSSDGTSAPVVATSADASDASAHDADADYTTLLPLNNDMVAPSSSDDQLDQTLQTHTRTDSQSAIVHVPVDDASLPQTQTQTELAASDRMDDELIGNGNGAGAGEGEGAGDGSGSRSGLGSVGQSAARRSSEEMTVVSIGHMAMHSASDNKGENGASEEGAAANDDMHQDE